MSEKDFIFSKSKDLSLSGIKNFPLDFIKTKNTKSLEVPDKELIFGKEFFGSFEISTPAGDFVFTTNDENEAKFIAYASRNRKNNILLPEDPKLIKSAVDEYEKYLDELLQEIKKEYLARFKNGKNLSSVSNEIFRKLNLTRL